MSLSAQRREATSAPPVMMRLLQVQAARTPEMLPLGALMAVLKTDRTAVPFGPPFAIVQFALFIGFAGSCQGRLIS